MKKVISATDARFITRFKKALKEVTERHLAPELSKYCFRTWAGETPWTAETRDGFRGRLILELLESTLEQNAIAPPFMGNVNLQLTTIEGLSKNIKVTPGDCRNLLAGQKVPKYVARSCEIVFSNMRKEGLYVY